MCNGLVVAKGNNIMGIKLLFYLIVLAFAVIVGGLVVLFTTGAVAFSKITMALLAASTIQPFELVTNNSFLNFVAWACVYIALVYLLSALPRMSLAIQFFSTVFITQIVVSIAVSMIFALIYSAANGENFQLTLLYEIIIRLVSLGAAVVGVAVQEKKLSTDETANPILRNIERAVASLLYGAGVTFLFVTFNQNWTVPALVYWLVFIVAVVGSFAGDILLKGKFLFWKNDNTVIMPK